ncbi:MAG: cob(I)yrinic acid a,c-diamide adenosyltransferase [Planctomycetota bacterium]
MKIYTKTGDTGQTGLIGGQRVDKHHPRVETYGGVDELNAAIGWVLVTCADTALANELRQIQDELFVLGAELATDDAGRPPTRIEAPAVARLEVQLDRSWARVPELHHFVLPGGSELAARLHLARTVCRRAERAVVALSQRHPVGPQVVPYLNRLGDLLFAYARLANHLNHVEDVVWIAPEQRA